MKYYKFLAADGSCCHGGTGSWFLPTGSRHGKWMPEIKGPLEACSNGYHLCRPGDLLEWAQATLWEAEYRGDRITVSDKIVVRQARLLRRVDNWNDRILRLFACDCAERALTHVEKPDHRSVNAIAVARKFANGEATSKELAAARDAAWAAAWDAAWDAAWAAAWDAAWDAARAAARDAARDAAREEEVKWQKKHIIKYLNGKYEKVSAK